MSELILILDERHGPVDERLRLENLRRADIAIRVTQDAVLIMKNRDSTLIDSYNIKTLTGKGEPELNAEKAADDKANNARDEQPAAESHITRFRRAFGDSDTKDEDLTLRPDPWG